MEFLILEPTPAQLRDARCQARITQRQAAEISGLHLSSYKRQEQGKSRVSPAVFKLLLFTAGRIHGLEWSGWSINNGRIWSPENTGYTPGDIASIHWLDQSIRFLRSELMTKTGDYYDQEWFHGYRFRSTVTG